MKTILEKDLLTRILPYCTKNTAISINYKDKKVSNKNQQKNF